MKKRLLLFLILSLSLSAFAQVRVSGKVVDESGSPLVGVNIVEKSLIDSKKNGTITDIDGNFVLTTKQNYVII